VSVREGIQKHSKVFTVISAVLLVITISWIVYQVSSVGAMPDVKYFYTVDDGKTFFAGEPGLVPPFTHDGKQAYIARLIECGGVKRVGFMERYTPAAKKVMERINAGDKNITSTELDAIRDGHEFKKPGDQKWKVLRDELEKSAFKYGIRCPDGKPPTWLQ
jgi:hypothetical protein